jgi:hypothetical protein
VELRGALARSIAADRPRMPAAGAAAALVLIAALLAGAVPTQAASDGWTAPRPLSERGEDALFSTVAGKPGRTRHGRRAVAVWQAGESTRAAFVNRHGRTRAPKSLGAFDQTSPALPPSLPAAAVDRRGEAIALWTRADGDGELRIVAAVAEPDGGFGAPRELSAPGGSASGPEIAFDQRGNALALWVRSDGDGGLPLLQSALKRRGEERFGEPQTISAEGEPAVGPVLGIDREGVATIAWCLCTPSVGQIQVARGPIEGSFDERQVVSDPAQYAVGPTVAVARSGKSIVGWSAAEGFDPSRTYVSPAMPAPNGDFLPQQQLSDPRADATSPELAIRNGTVTALFRETLFAEARQRLVAATGAWHEPDGTSEVLDEVPFSAGRELAREALSVAPGGAAIAAWASITAGDTPDPFGTVLAASRARGADGFGEPVRLSDPGRSSDAPSLSAARASGAVAIWQLTEGTSDSVGIEFSTHRGPLG